MVVQLKNNASFLRNTARNKGIAQKKINDSFREAGQEAGRWWINTCLHRHFEHVAYSMYGYKRRSYRWTQKKLHAKKAFDINTGQTFPAQQPPKPLVWTGSLRDFVLGAKNFYQVKATSKYATTDERQIITVTVPIRLNHPINPKNAGEITKLAPSEWRQMRSMIFARVKKTLRIAMYTLIRGKAA